MNLDDEGSSFVNKIASNIQKLNQNVQNLNVLVDKIGGMEDTEETKNDMSRLIQESNFLSKSTSSLIKSLVTLSNDNRQLRVQRELLMNNYMGVLNSLQSAQRKAASKEKAKIKTVTNENEMLSSEEDTFNQNQLQDQRHINLNEIRERQQALVVLESDINDVNVIFRDLARIVHDQGEMVDSIEANIEHASISVEQGHVNVQQSLYYQNKSRQKKLIVFAFFTILLFIILLFLYLWTR